MNGWGPGKERQSGVTTPEGPGASLLLRQTAGLGSDGSQCPPSPCHSRHCQMPTCEARLSHGEAGSPKQVSLARSFGTRVCSGAAWCIQVL